jgi:hypothetical protein
MFNKPSDYTVNKIVISCQLHYILYGIKQVMTDDGQVLKMNFYGFVCGSNLNFISAK